MQFEHESALHGDPAPPQDWAKQFSMTDNLDATRSRASRPHVGRMGTRLQFLRAAARRRLRRDEVSFGRKLISFW